MPVSLWASKGLIILVFFIFFRIKNYSFLQSKVAFDTGCKTLKLTAGSFVLHLSPTFLGSPASKLNKPDDYETQPFFLTALLWPFLLPFSM